MLAATYDIPGAVPLSEQAGVALRELRKSDLRKLAWWYNHTVPRDARQRRYRSASDMEKHLFKLTSRDSCHRAILMGGRLIGYCGWNDHMEAFIFIGRPEWRGLGIGTKAMRFLLQEFRQRRRFAMSAKTNRPDFWAKLGFQEVRNDWRLRPQDAESGHVMMLWDRREHNGNA